MIILWFLKRDIILGYHYGDYYQVILLGYYMDIIISMAYYYGVIPKVISDYNGILLW